jgi:hypothetical protein
MHSLMWSMLLIAGISSAADEPTKTLRVASPQEFAPSRALIEQALAESERFRKLSDRERLQFVRALDRMEATLSGVAGIDELDRKSRTQLFNDQELINNVLTQASDDARLICKREKLTGTRRISDVCVTVAQRERHREGALEANFKVHRGQRGGNSLF